jgi:hypothetical protein
VGDRGRTGVLLVRVWTEEGKEGLRARITAVGDVSDGVMSVTFATSVADITSAVTDWLQDFVDGGPS